MSGESWNDYSLRLLGELATAIGSSAETVQALTDGATIDWDTDAGKIATLTLTGNHTVANPSGLVPGRYAMVVTQDPTGGWAITWGSVFGRSPEIRKAPGSTTTLEWVYDGTYMRPTAEASSRSDVIFSSTSTPMLNQPAATTELYGSSRRRYVDWTGRQEVQLQATVTTAGFAGATLGLQYSIDDGTTWYFLDGSADGDLGSYSPQVPIGAAGQFKSSWTLIATAARRAGVLIRAITDNGNGVADPAFNYVAIVSR